MAITLTKEYQLLEQSELGSWGFGTLFLRMYAKYDSQSIEKNTTTYTVQARIYNNGSYCNSGNCYAKIDDTLIQDNVEIGFTKEAEIILGSKQFTITHDDDGTKGVEKSASFYCYALPTENTIKAWMVMPDIPRYATSKQSLNSKTETTIKMNWSSDNTIDYIWYSINNGSTWTGIDITDATSGNYTITGLTANTTYSIKTRVRRKDSQLTTDSSSLSIKTYALPTQSLKSKTETTVTMNWSADSTVDMVYYSTDNGSTWSDGISVNATSGSYTISGLAANTTYNIKTRVRRKATQTLSNTSNLEIKTYQYPYVSAVSKSNLVIGNSQTLTIYNPLGRKVSVYMYQHDTGIKLYEGETSSTTITFTPNKTTMYNSIPNSSTGNCYYYCVYSGQIMAYKNGTYSIVRDECIPSFNSFNAEDVNTNTLSLTGNNQVVVKGYSNIKVTIPVTNKAIAKNGATIKYYTVVAGNKVLKLDYSSTENISGTINNVDISEIAVYAVDSRGLGSQVVSRSFIFKEYVKPSVNDFKVYRENGIGTKALFNINGTFWNGNFGAKQNSIYQINFHYKKKTDTNFSELINITNQITSSDGTYKNKDGAFLPTTSGGSTAIELQVGTEYDIQFIVSDQAVLLVYTFSGAFTLNNGIPCTAKQQNDDGSYSVGINCLPDENYALKVNGYLKAKMRKGTKNIYVNTTSDVKSTSQYTTLVEDSITTYGGELLINAHSYLHNISAAFWLRVYIEIDGVNVGYILDGASTSKECKSGSMVAKNITAGTHTIKLRVYNANGAYEFMAQPAFTSCGMSIVELWEV